MEESSPWLVLPSEQSNPLDVLSRVSVLLVSLFDVASSHPRKVVIPTPAAIDHFFRVLRSDPALKPSSAVLAVKRRALENFACYCSLAESALLLHHARIMEILFASLSWAQSHGNAMMEEILACYSKYVQHVPVGHLEQPLFQAVMNLDLELLGLHIARLVECRPGLWAALPVSRRYFLEQQIAMGAMRGTPDLASTGARIILSSSRPCYPLLIVAVANAGVGPHLAALALRARPPAPVWPNQIPVYHEEAQGQGRPMQQAQHVFSEFAGLIPTDNKRSDPPTVTLASESQVESKRLRLEPSDFQVAATVVEKETSTWFQPTLQVFELEKGEDENDELDDLPMIVDESPSNSEGGE